MADAANMVEMAMGFSVLHSLVLSVILPFLGFPPPPSQSTPPHSNQPPFPKPLLAVYAPVNTWSADGDTHQVGLDISTENNISILSGLKMLKQIIEGKAGSKYANLLPTINDLITGITAYMKARRLLRLSACSSPSLLASALSLLLPLYACFGSQLAPPPLCLLATGHTCTHTRIHVPPPANHPLILIGPTMAGGGGQQPERQVVSAGRQLQHLQGRVHLERQGRLRLCR